MMKDTNQPPKLYSRRLICIFLLLQSIWRMMRAGFSMATDLEGISLATTEPAPSYVILSRLIGFLVV